MNFLFPELDLAGLWSGAASAIAGKGMLGALATSSSTSSAGDLDLDDPQQNLMAMLKFRGDISGEDVVLAFPGEVWATLRPASTQTSANRSSRLVFLPLSARFTARMSASRHSLSDFVPFPGVFLAAKSSS